MEDREEKIESAGVVILKEQSGYLEMAAAGSAGSNMSGESVGTFPKSMHVGGTPTEDEDHPLACVCYDSSYVPVAPTGDIEEAQTSSPGSILDFADTIIPYANDKIIYRWFNINNINIVIIIDPWTQHWIIAEEPVPSMLRLADGRRRLTEIIRTVMANAAPSMSASELVAVARELFAAGFLFKSQAEHRSNGLPVYNECAPLGLHLEITNACNTTCSHCYVASGKKLAGELTLEEIYKTVDMLPPFSGRRIAISGGEPAVRRDCGDIIEYCAHRRGHDVDLYTNGKRFPEALADRILAINQRQVGRVRIQLSLEGATAETNDLVRGPGSFAATLASLEMFGRKGLTRIVVIFVCITKYNIHQIDDLIKLAERYDVSMLVFSQWQRQGNASSTPWASIAPTVEEWVAAGERLLSYSNPRLMVFGNFHGDLSNNRLGRFSLDGQQFPKHIYFYNAYPRVSPDGKIFADQLWVDPDWALGNVRENTLEEAFNSSKFRDQLEQMRRRTQNIVECRGCEWRELCEGGSPGHTYAEYGDMNHRDWFCESRKAWFNRYVEYQISRVFAS